MIHNFMTSTEKKKISHFLRKKPMKENVSKESKILQIPALVSEN